VTTSDLSASHYLGIYRLRLSMAEDGTTHPSAKGMKFMRELVVALEALSPDEPVRLETTSHLARFSSAKTGNLLAEVAIADQV
jgi:hypothetical protein